MSSKYLQSIQEVRQWLSYKKLDEYIYILLDNGYDDLSAIALCNQQERQELEALFTESDTRRALHVLVESLRSIGIDAYRKQKNEFRRMTQADSITSIQPSSIPASPREKNHTNATLDAERKAIESRSRVSSTLKPAHAFAHVNKDGYAGVRINDSHQQDKFVVLKGTFLRVYASRRDLSLAEADLNLHGNLLNVSKSDSTTLVLTTAIPEVRRVELAVNNRMEVEEWMEAFNALLPGAHSRKPSVDTTRPSMAVKRPCAVENCPLQAFGKGMYCPQHTNQYRRGSIPAVAAPEPSVSANTSSSSATSNASVSSALDFKSTQPDPPARGPSMLTQALVGSGRSIKGGLQAHQHQQHQQQHPVEKRKTVKEVEEESEDEKEEKYGGGANDDSKSETAESTNESQPPPPHTAAMHMQTQIANESSSAGVPPSPSNSAASSAMYVSGSTTTGAGSSAVESMLDEMLDNYQRGDHQSFDGAVAANARVRAYRAFAGCVFESISEEGIGRILGTVPNSTHDNRVKTYLKLLYDGAVFKKYKHGNGSKRLIWCTPQFDFLIWSDDEKQTVKGFLRCSEIQEINQGFGKNKCRLYLVSEARTLELEAKDAQMAKEWKAIFEFLIQSNNFELEARRELKSRPMVHELLVKCHEEHRRLLEEGDVFKKWPGKKAIQKGGFQHRKILADPEVKRLQWVEIETGKVKGFILMDDVVHLQADRDDKLKFTIYAMDRSLDLEAKSVWVREKWLKAIKFFIQFGR